MRPRRRGTARTRPRSSAAAPWLVCLLLAVAIGASGCRPFTPARSGAPATASPSPAAPAPLARATAGARPATRAPSAVAAGPAEPVGDPLTEPTPLRDLNDLARRLRRPPAAAAAAAPRPERQVGLQERFWIADQARRRYFPISATLRYKTDHLYMYVQDGQASDQEGVRKAADELERAILPTDERVFGALRIQGPDGDPRISVINGDVPGVSGYFSSGDTYAAAVMPFSNGRLALYANVRAVQPGSAAYASMLAHELQHIIEFGRRPRAEAWLNEGASMLAQDVNGLPLGANVPRAFFQHPETQLTAWDADAESNAPHYAAAYLWLRYFTARFGGPEIMRSLLASGQSDLGAFEELLRRRGEPERLPDVVADWSVANYLNDARIGDGRYGYGGIAGNAAETGVVAEGMPYEGWVRPYASNYVVVQAGPGRTIRFRGDRAASLMGQPPPPGARAEWWSNRGDRMDATLTRSLDLSSATTAHLSYDIWYDVERDFDYGYVEVSTDGTTWKPVSTEHTTLQDPNGASYGAGYTGVSGDSPAASGPGLRTPSWVHETIDLSPYAGAAVSLRFEYVTDDSYNGPGIAVANLAVPEIGWYDNPERRDGWQSQGWLPTTNRVPQEYRVQLIALGDVPRILRVPLDQAEEGSIVVPEGAGKSVLVVNAFAPKTTERSGYEVTVEAPHSG